MGTVQVKTIHEMKRENRLFLKRVEASQTRMLMRMANLNQEKSNKIASEVKFKGTLMSQIQTKFQDKKRILVISSAPHSYAIEKGEPDVRGYVSFSEAPGLEEWVRNKLRAFDPKKADYFLGRQAVLIGTKGFPYGYPKGLRFMEQGYQHAAMNANHIIADELVKLGTITAGSIALGGGVSVSAIGEISI